VARVSNTFVTSHDSSGLRNDGGTMESWQNNKVRGNAFDYQGSGVLTNVSQQ
jgi:hypothetical protein